VLTAAVFDFQKDPLKITYFLGDMTLLDDDVLLGRGLRFNGRTGVLGAVVFTRDSFSRKWSQQQILQLSQDVEGFDIDGHTIVLAVPSQRGLSGVEGAGAVHVLYPNTKEFSASEIGTVAASSHSLHTRGLQWSSRQILYAAEEVQNGNFGSDLSLYENQLIVGQQGTSTIHVFSRGTRAGQWLPIQTINPSVPMKFFSDNYLHGTSLLLVGFPLTFGVPHLPSVELYAQTSQWSCLVLTLEDVFGDGWAGATLQVQTPDGDVDEFSAHCDFPNPISFRYCPLHAADGGVYTLSVEPDVMVHKFFWELQWRVFDEFSGATHMGNFATKMEFEFDTDSLAFVYSKVSGALVLPAAACVPCEAAGAGALALELSGSNWFSSSYLGTNYYVSDIAGLKLVGAGSSCSSTERCLVSLPDGSYVLRIGGDLNSLRRDNSWKFCGLSGDGSGAHIVFEISEKQCELLAVYSKASYCSENLQAQAVLEGVLDVTLESSPSVSALTAADRAQLAYALSDQDSQLLQVKDVEVEGMAAIDQKQFAISFAIRMNTASAGENEGAVDPHDYAAVQAMVQGVAQQLEIGVKKGAVRDALRSTTRVPDSFFFSSTSDVTLSKVVMRKRITLIETLSQAVEFDFTEHS
jgi:hypothetical protein